MADVELSAEIRDNNLSEFKMSELWDVQVWRGRA